MTLSNEGYMNLQRGWDLAVDLARLETPAGFEFIGFLWGHDFTHGPFLAKADGPPGPIGQAIYGKVEPKKQVIHARQCGWKGCGHDPCINRKVENEN